MAAAKPLVTSWSQQPCVSPGEGSRQKRSCKNRQITFAFSREKRQTSKQKKKIARGSEYFNPAGSEVSSFIIEKREQSTGMVWGLKVPEWWLGNLSVQEGAHTDGKASDQNFANCLMQFYLTRLLTQSWENKCPLSKAPWARGLTHPGSNMLWEEDNPIEVYWEHSASCVLRCLVA